MMRFLFLRLKTIVYNIFKIQGIAKSSKFFYEGMFILKVVLLYFLYCSLNDER